MKSPHLLALNAFGSSTPTEFTEYGGKVFFVADDGIHGRELMSLNPADETTAVFDITQGSGGSEPAKLFVLGDKLFFTVQSGGSTHLFSCDGSAAHEVAMACDLSYVDRFFVSGNTAYFAGYEVDTGLEPWSFDGSSARRLADLNSGQAWSSPHAFIEHQGSVYFASDDGNGATSLWQVAGASVSKFLARATGSGSVTHMLSFGNEIVFVSARVENDQVKRSLEHLSGAGLLSSDALPYEPTADWPLLAAGSSILFSGAPAGSTEVKLYSWSVSGYQAAGMATYPQPPKAYNGTLYYAATGIGSGTRLYQYVNGVESLVDKVKDYSRVGSVTVIGNTIYAGADLNGSEDRELLTYPL